MASTALSPQATDRVIQMAWEDRTPFEAIEAQFGLKESDVIRLMRSNLKRQSFELWRKRVNGRRTTHVALRDPGVNRFKSYDQKG
ncbi:MAG: TIGR03643 family protein [Burkholderiales bacterium]